ncbi:uncharacterized protein MYCFIDRAFT_85077 [Pseudocercospora fijiensis CIRAD86]|uniref:phosphogluconate dehydrogenase (NADP(+)-dependent, decarboxylating) n=1 Tax=Pseudocercospora fijiensis (strain CIRAD86) TaxID=383855 RepID=M2Z1M8_PSEFD|nr:uncharacterized protein MYCFIDRAFT_85077 [Pseudocercospora fijiensis CIRAD86]EME83725.1 hypothetical protein MYCFIDRAFT_85077 [Pseudocercospora fijiensis CIRAD86]
MASTSDINKIAMIGCGAMGGGMALLFAENGCDVFLRDPSSEAMSKVLDQAKKDNVSEKISKYQDNESLCKAFGSSTKVFFWSLPHGQVGDTVLDGLMPYLKKDDIIIDCANEHWENTERRIGKTTAKGIRYVGMGVSGGYQAARRGPSMCPGTDSQTFDIVLPLLRKAAAKAPDGSPCVGRIGTGGAGHYTKMIHNGIEHGMMSAICEAWAIMKKGLGMSEDEVGDVFNRWNAKGELQDLRLATYAACLASYIQGLNIIAAADAQKHLNVDYPQLLHIWRAGCIIQADYISTKLLQPHYRTSPATNPLSAAPIAHDLRKSFPSLKNVVVKATEADHVVPSLSATLEYLKFMTSTDLPTSFQEAQLDYFGRHMFDVKGEDVEGLPRLGVRHYEWKEA